jgi:hypothetical protein
MRHVCEHSGNLIVRPRLHKKRNNDRRFKMQIFLYLCDNETKFREYFRVSRNLFDVILTSIKEDIKRSKCNGVLKPVCVEEKLCLALW